MLCLKKYSIRTSSTLLPACKKMMGYMVTIPMNVHTYLQHSCTVLGYGEINTMSAMFSPQVETVNKLPPEQDTRSGSANLFHSALLEAHF